MADKIIALDENGDYIAVEMDVSGGYFALSGSSGEIMSEEILDQSHEEYASPEQMEEDFGYIWEEKELEEYDDIIAYELNDAQLEARREYYDELEKLDNRQYELQQKDDLSDEEQDELDEIESEFERVNQEIEERADELAHERADEEIRERKEQFFEDLARDMEWPQPFELNYDVGSAQVDGKEWYATTQSAGQIDMHLTDVTPLIPREDVAFIFDAWRRYHLKELNLVPQQVIDRIRTILGGIDNEAVLELAVRQDLFRGAETLRVATAEQIRERARERREQEVRSALARVRVAPYFRARS